MIITDRNYYPYHTIQPWNRTLHLNNNRVFPFFLPPTRRRSKQGRRSRHDSASLHLCPPLDSFFIPIHVQLYALLLLQSSLLLKNIYIVLGLCCNRHCCFKIWLNHLICHRTVIDLRTVFLRRYQLRDWARIILCYLQWSSASLNESSFPVETLKNSLKCSAPC